MNDKECPCCGMNRISHWITEQGVHFTCDWCAGYKEFVMSIDNDWNIDVRLFEDTSKVTILLFDGEWWEDEIDLPVVVIDALIAKLYGLKTAVEEGLTAMEQRP